MSFFDRLKLRPPRLHEVDFFIFFFLHNVVKSFKELTLSYSTVQSEKFHIFLKRFLYRWSSRQSELFKLQVWCTTVYIITNFLFLALNVAYWQ